jgi:anti-sigma factor RsiW
MKSPSSRDLEQLSAYLDGQLSQSDRTRLEIRIQSDPALASVLDEFRQTRTFLRRTPQRRAPRNFTLTPRMAGIRPPVPRLVPALSWASAVAMLLFIFTLGAGLVGQLSFGAAATAPAPALFAFGNGASAASAPAAPATAAPATMAPVVAAPAPMLPATAAPATSTPTATAPSGSDSSNPPVPTEQASSMAVEQATPPAVARVAQLPSTSKAQQKRANIWLFIWPGLAVLLAGLALLVFWLNKRAFQRKNPRSRLPPK